MADVTISSLPKGTPSGSEIIPFSTGSSTQGTPVSAIFQNVSAHLGIGTTAPSYPFQVNSQNPNRGIIGLLYNNAVSNHSGAQLQITQSGIGNWVAGMPAGEHAFSIWEGRNALNSGSEKMRINSNGDVTISGSLRVAGLDRVYAALTSGPYVYPSGIIKWNTVLLNTNNSYNSSTGYFTANKSGIYRVSAYWISSGAGDYFIRKNDSNYAIAHNNHNDTWDNSSITCLVSLNIGDTIGFFYQQAASYSGGLYGNAYNGYSIEQLP